MANAIIVLHPVDGQPDAPRPFATADAQGRFTLTSRVAGDGAKPGKYSVTLRWLTPLDKAEGDGPVQRVDRLGGKYADPAKSKLPQVEITPETRQLPGIEL